jgi:hypothetical protein
LTPISLTGSAGTATPVRIDGDYGGWSSSDDYCYVNASKSDLRAGTWRVQASTPLWSTSCDVGLDPGWTRLHFQEHGGGCRTDLGWP